MVDQATTEITEGTQAMEDRKSLSEAIRERIDNAYEGNQAAFARAMEMSTAYVNHLVTGKIRQPGPEIRRGLCRELGVRHVDLLVMMGELEPEETGGVATPLPQDETRLLTAFRKLGPNGRNSVTAVVEEMAKRD